mgnify:CR=1 FL=1
MFIVVFEGLDGSGKTTIMKKVYKELSKQYKVAMFPSLTESYYTTKVIRDKLAKHDTKDLDHFFMLHHVEFFKDLQSYLDYDFILKDRYIPSTLAYGDSGKDPAFQKFIADLLKVNLVSPELYVHVNTDVRKCLERLKSRDNLTCYETESKLKEVDLRYKDIYELDGIKLEPGVKKNYLYTYDNNSALSSVSIDKLVSYIEWLKNY